MTNTTAAPAADRQDERKRKRGAVLKFSLAGVALLGIGAAATSAQWSDNAWFSGTAAAATVELEGQVTATGAASVVGSWVTADGVAGDPAIAIDSSKFGSLLPGVSKSIDLHLKNTGSSDLALPNGTIQLVTGGDTILTTGTATTALAAVTVSAVPAAGAVLSPDEETVVSLTVSPDSAWVTSVQGKSQAFVVKFAGAAQ